MSAREELAHGLKMKFGLAPSEPDDDQLDLIIKDIERIKAAGKDVTEADWQKSVYKHVPQAGKHFYGGLDYSDLNSLFLQAKKQSK